MLQLMQIERTGRGSVFLSFFVRDVQVVADFEVNVLLQLHNVETNLKHEVKFRLSLWLYVLIIDAV
jgi:hypothetical protein